MMCERQVYGRNPATGRVEHYYRDLGPMATGVGRERPLVRTFIGGGSPGAHLPQNGGAKVKTLKGLGR